MLDTAPVVSCLELYLLRAAKKEKFFVKCNLWFFCFKKDKSSYYSSKNDKEDKDDEDIASQSFFTGTGTAYSASVF
ncbi:MAG: hypothetical protein D3913_12825 [Candidatus Electrothrix sp. LOE1_4_5]|nr:hypothetical protein [Candidatus Electrothrix gigas]